MRAERSQRTEAMLVERIAIRAEGLVGTLCLPHDGNALYPIIVLGGSNPWMPEPEAALLASQGFAALALLYFGAPGLQSSLLHVALEYFETAMHWLQEQPRVSGPGIGLVGTSRGGELALLLGATYPNVRGVVAFSPSAVVWSGIIKRFQNRFDSARVWLPGSGRGWRWAAKAAWVLGGQPVPYLQPSSRHMLRAEILSLKRPRVPDVEVHHALLRDKAAVEHALIPVERINGPILLFSGQRDAVWPSTMFCHVLMARLAAREHPYADTHFNYPDGGHRFPLGMDCDPWMRAVEFLRSVFSASREET